VKSRNLDGGKKKKTVTIRNEAKNTWGGGRRKTNAGKASNGNKEETNEKYYHEFIMEQSRGVGKVKRGVTGDIRERIKINLHVMQGRQATRKKKGAWGTMSPKEGKDGVSQ